MNIPDTQVSDFPLKGTRYLREMTETRSEAGQILDEPEISVEPGMLGSQKKEKAVLKLGSEEATDPKGDNLKMKIKEK